MSYNNYTFGQPAQGRNTGINIPFVNLTKHRGTGIPFVDFDFNNPKPNPQQGLETLGNVNLGSFQGNIEQGVASGGLTQLNDNLQPSGNTLSAQQSAQRAEAARVAAQQAADRARFGEQRQGIHTSAGEAASAYGSRYNTGILDFVDQLTGGQRAIDEGGVQNELARRQGAQGVLGMVGRGIRSGNTILSNKNSADSSAAERVANAYGQIGRGELSNVGNQYELGNRQLGLQQEDLERQRAGGVRRLTDDKNQAVNSIVLDARDRFAQLDAAMQNASLPDRIAIEQEKEQVRQTVLSQLQQFDQMLTERTGGVKPRDVDYRRSEAARLAGLGQAPEDAFNFSTEVPAQFAGSGPFSTEVPLFTLPRKRMR